MERLSLARLGAICALVTVAGFVAGIALMATSGVQLLIPETGDVPTWIADVDAAGAAFFVGAWIVVFAGFTGIVALVGFWDALRSAGPVLVVAPIVGAVGLTLVTFSHVLPVAMAYELVPGYLNGDAASRETLLVTADTLASLCLLTNYAGNALGWGVAVPLYAFAILTTSLLPRWIGWLGVVVAVFAGWLGLLGPASSAIEGISAIGFFGFFVFMTAMGVAILRRPARPQPLTAPPVAV
jgi:hypothetical protein